MVLSGYGLNCEEETAFAFSLAGAKPEIVHVNDLISKEKSLSDFDILAIPGGFSYGDDTGSGNAFAYRLKNNMGDELSRFIDDGKLAIGICNGFQILANLGLLPALGKVRERQAALVHNDSARYTVRWVDLKFTGKGPWLTDLDEMMLPIAHGEGRLVANPEVLDALHKKNLVGAKYVAGEITNWQGLRPNPNGSTDGIAAITDETGRVLGIMPHPERAVRFTHLPHWTYLREKLSRQGKQMPQEGPGLRIFQNAVAFFQ